jgi:deoxycytidine triphosphate deaminase
MDALAEELRRSVDARQKVLLARIAHLRGILPGDRLALARVLDLFAFFPQALMQVVDAEWERNPSAISRVQLLRPLLRHVTDVATFVEEWLGHTGTPAVPLYLLKAVERSCISLGLDKHQAVIATGPADNFTTVVSGLEEILFKKLGPLCPPVPPELVHQVSLMRVPRLEGTRVLWHPILLGHELAHLAVKSYDALNKFNLQDTFDMRRAVTIPVPGMGTPGPAGALRLFEIGENWAEELLCDAFAVRSFGVGAVASLGEFLEVISATDHLSDTHPPGRLRVHMLVQWIGTIMNARVENIVAPWRTLAAETVVYTDEWAQFLVETLIDRRNDLAITAGSWPGNDYDTNERSNVIIAAAGALRAGVPPEPTVLDNDTRKAVSDPDVITAAWIGRVEAFETPTERLAEKSLDNLEFLRQWCEVGGSLPVPQPSDGKAVIERATLSTADITLRLFSPNDDRLIVTPLLPDYASGASMDLRLGNTFIVFVRSRTPSFDPLNEQQDPRQVQRSMQLTWGDTFVLHPGELVLAATLEYLVFPSDLSAQVVTRSSYGRLGLLSATAVQVHPYFHGCLTLELVNLGTVPLLLTPGERVAQLVLAPANAAPPPPPSKYHCPIGPEFSKVRTDDEVAILRGLGGIDYG